MNVNILVFNCGSSSLKYRLIEMPSEREIAGGEAQRIGPKTAEPSMILHREKGIEEKIIVDMPSHERAFEEILKLLSGGKGHPVDAIGHRVVHDGGIFKKHVLSTMKQ